MTFLNQDTPLFSRAERMRANGWELAAYFASVTRPRRGYYECRLERITSDMSEYPDYKLTERYMQMLEAEIKRNPHLWLWTHRRWKHNRAEVEKIQGNKE